MKSASNKLAAVLIFALILGGCKDETNQRDVVAAGGTGEVSIRNYKSHQYVVYNKPDAVAMVHDPDCPCGRGAR